MFTSLCKLFKTNKNFKQAKNTSTKQSTVKSTLITVLALFSTILHAIELDTTKYQVFYGDLNQDQIDDIYLVPNQTFLPIAGEITFIIPIDGEGDRYKLIAQSSGYDEPVIDNTLSYQGLQKGAFNLLSGDFNGDGIDDVLLQSTSQNRLSLTLAADFGSTTPYILQTFANISSDTHSISISDANNDGRDDIQYQANGTSQTLYADNHGHLQYDGQAQTSAHYGYDYLSQRKYKVVESLGQPRKEVIYIDENTELRNGVLYKYVQLGKQKIARSQQGSGQFSASEFYLHNHLGSTALTLDASGRVENAFTYGPYGGAQISHGEIDVAPYGFTGKEQDPESKLGYFHHRYLDSAAGRFITPDPVFELSERFTDPQQWSPYAYGRNNPIAYVDPDGQVVKLVTTGGKLIHKAYKQYRKTGKLDAKSLKKAGMDELVGIADDLNTIFMDGDAGFVDKIGAGIDLLTGFETTDGKIRETYDLKPAGKKVTRSGPPRHADGRFKKVDGPTAGKKVDSATRKRILDRDQNPDGSWTCATCGQSTTNPANIHTGHIKARSQGGDLSDGNLRCEGAACNLSQGAGSAPKPGRTCAARGSCGAPYGRTD